MGTLGLEEPLITKTQSSEVIQKVHQFTGESIKSSSRAGLELVAGRIWHAGHMLSMHKLNGDVIQRCASQLSEKPEKCSFVHHIAAALLARVPFSYLAVLIFFDKIAVIALDDQFSFQPSYLPGWGILAPLENCCILGNWCSVVSWLSF